MSSVSKPRVRHNRHKQGLNLTLEKLSADFRLNKKLHGVDKQVIIAKSRSFLPEHPFRWTATKIAAVELGYAIYAAGVLNNGQTDIKEIMTFMEASFQIDLGDYYRTYITMKDRKKDRTSFLNSLIKSLLKKMDEDDNL